MFILTQMLPTLEGTTYDKGQTVAQFAQRFVGNSYVWDGTDLNRGADCSGFIGQFTDHLDIIFQELLLN